MTFEPLAKPGTLTGNSIVEGCISSNADASNVLFFIKPVAVQISSEVEVVEITGDGDSTRIYDHGGMASSRFQISGYMVADTAVKLINLPKTGSAGNDNANTNCTLTFRPHSSGRKIGGAVIFSSVEMQWAKNSPYVGVNISGVFTDNDFAASTEEA
jgi:hypothetical protein